MCNDVGDVCKKNGSVRDKYDALAKVREKYFKDKRWAILIAPKNRIAHFIKDSRSFSWVKKRFIIHLEWGREGG